MTELEKAIKVMKNNGYKLVKKTAKEPTYEEKLAEAKRVVMENGLKFVKESKRYAGRHPVFDSKKFQEYLLKECGTCCDDRALDCQISDKCCICPECDGDGCIKCDFTGYVDCREKGRNREVEDDTMNDIDDYDIENDDESFSYGPDEADEFIDDMAMQNFNNLRKGRRPRY